MPDLQPHFYNISLQISTRSPTMPLVTFDQGFGLGLAVGVIVTLVITLVVSALVLRSSDSAGLGQWKLNIDTPLPSMWMNVGYWYGQ